MSDGEIILYSTEDGAAEILQIASHAPAHLGQFGLDTDDLLLQRGDVDFFLRLEGIDVAGEVEVEVVLGDLVQAGAVGVFVDFGTGGVGL